VNRDIIVIGASAGGVEALKTVICALPGNLQAAIFIVLHVGRTPSIMPEILNSCGSLRAIHPHNCEAIQYGRVYIAPPDNHLIIESGHVHLSKGPRENRARPAIDPLFRSAALVYGRRVIGVVLSGMLDDGTLGLWEIKRRGGIAIVQDPQDSMYPDMPRSAVANVPVDYSASLSEISSLLQKVCCETIETEMHEPLEESKPENTTLTCPDCHGPLQRIRHGDVMELRCRVGHRFSQEAALDAHADSEERVLWSAIESLEEGAELLGHAGFELKAKAKRDLARQLRRAVTNGFTEEKSEADTSRMHLKH
jgi:two-component system chemotaxis response regulator CheB